LEGCLGKLPLALLSATKLCKKEHGTISSERHINYINNYLQDFGGIDPEKRATGLGQTG
jgi:hypothetical protein